MSERVYKKFDTYGWTVYMVKLAMDPRVFKRDDNDGEDVVLTFCDNSRIEGTTELWVDARLHSYHNDLGKVLKKGDAVQLMGKLRFKKTDDGLRGKIYDARLATYAGFDRGLTSGDLAPKDPVPPTFE